MKFWIGVIISLLIMTSAVVAEIEISGSPNDKIIDIINPEPPVNYSLVPTVNSSEFWDDLDTPADINLNDLGDTDVSAPSTNDFIRWTGAIWQKFDLYSFLNGLYLNLSGTNANQNMDISPYNFTAGSYFGDGRELTLAQIGSPSFKSLQDLQNLFHSSGVFNSNFTVPFILSNGDNTFNVTGGSGSIRATVNATGTLFFFDWTASNNIAIALNEVIYVGVEYNAGSPQVVTKSTSTWDSQQEFPLGSVVRDISGVHVQREDHAVGDHATNMVNRLFDTLPFSRDNRGGGLILGTSGLNITVTSGTIWEKLNEFPISAIDTSGSDTFDRYYRNGTGGWFAQEDNTNWNNTHYDDGTGTLNALGNNRWSIEWVYLEVDGEIVTLFGQEEFITFGGAEGSSPPSTAPDRIQVHSRIIGRIIFQEDATDAAATESVFTTQFSVAGVTDHGDLAGLSDDDHTQYLLASGSRSLTGNWDAGAFNVSIGGILNVDGFSTGDVISNEIDAVFGNNNSFGAISVGSTEQFVSDMFIGGLNLNGTYVVRNRDGDSNIKFAWVGKNDKVRLAIPKEGTAFALYNPRSEMIGGNLGQAYDNGIINCTAQGYDFIDCSTDVSGADLGVQDDIEFWGSLYGGNGTWNVSDGGNIATDGNITSDWATFTNLNVTGNAFFESGLRTDDIFSFSGTTTFRSNLDIVPGANFRLGVDGEDNDGQFHLYSQTSGKYVTWQPEDNAFEIHDDTYLVLGVNDFKMYYNAVNNTVYFDGSGLTDTTNTPTVFTRNLSVERIFKVNDIEARTHVVDVADDLKFSGLNYENAKETLNLRFNANWVTFSSPTGLALVEWDLAHKLKDNKAMIMGTNNDISLGYDETTTDKLVFSNSNVVGTNIRTSMDPVTGDWNYYENDLGGIGNLNVTKNITIGSTGFPGCITVRDSDDAGWSSFQMLNGAFVNSTGVC